MIWEAGALTHAQQLPLLMEVLPVLEASLWGSAQSLRFYQLLFVQAIHVLAAESLLLLPTLQLASTAALSSRISVLQALGVDP